LKQILNRNKLFIILFICISFFVFCWYLYDNNVFEQISNYLFHYNDFLKANILSDTPFTGSNFFDYLIDVFNNPGLYYFDYNIIFAFQMFQLLMPIFYSIIGYYFYKQYHSYLVLEFYRIQNNFRFLVSKMVINSLKLSVCIFFSFLLFYLYLFIICKGNFVMNPHNDDIPKSFLLDIFSDNFYRNNAYQYYLIEGSIKFLLIPFVFSMFAQSFVLIFSNLKVVVFLPCLYYYGLAVISFIMYNFIGDNNIYLNPSTILANSDYDNLNSVLLIGINLIPLLIAIIIIKIMDKRVEIS
jgi:hypothetical protein